MNPLWRDRIVAIVAGVAAIWLSVELAQGAWSWPLLVGAITLGAILARLTAMPLDVLLLGALLFGYTVGNRGFAQLMVVPGLPLLPAELGLAVTGAVLLLRCTFGKTLPIKRDGLNYLLLAWMLVGTARFLFDYPQYGFMALRDYAMVYYVAFFFITQELSREEAHYLFLLRCLRIASVCLPVVFVLSETFPGFFLGTLTIHGVPLVFFKGDLVATFLAVGAIILYLTAEGMQRWWARPLAVGIILWVIAGDNRASMLGALVALLWVGVSRFRSFAFVQCAVVALAIVFTAALSGLAQNDWAERKLHGLADRAMSVVDLTGHQTYRIEENTVKSDNNQFRWVWWRTVVSETLSRNPALGLGFGYDLARGFLQEYNPDMAEDFTARSPHSILVTSLGRMGIVGLALFVTFLVMLARRTWRVLRDPRSDATQVALWVALWPIAISAHLGVVLEGPMGAVVFWSLLGLAHSYRSPAPAAEESATETFVPIEAPETSALATAPRRAT